MSYQTVTFEKLLKVCDLCGKPEDRWKNTYRFIKIRRPLLEINWFIPTTKRKYDVHEMCIAALLDQATSEAGAHSALNNGSGSSTASMPKEGIKE